MFCPICKQNYRIWVRTCPDCRVKLVKPVPTNSETESFEYTEVLATRNCGDIAFIKSVLDSADIVYFFQGEHFVSLKPYVTPARLMVKKDQVEEAKELLKDLELNFNIINLDKNSKEK